MVKPYLLMAAFYLALAILAAIDSTFTNLGLLPWFEGLRWLRVHIITLGVLTEAIFGMLPAVAAIQRGEPRSRTRWDIWLSLNIGLAILLIGMPSFNPALILAGGTLIFIAAVLLLLQLRGGRHPSSSGRRPQPTAGRAFYLAGLAYLLLGVVVGTGIFLGWGSALHIAVPIEVHLHSNVWGFAALVFAGLIIDFYADFAGRLLAWPRSVPAIFWMMTLGAFGLVAGPWLQSNWFFVPGVVLHMAATLLLLANIIVPLMGDKVAFTPGILHIVTAYAWIVAPVAGAVLVNLSLLPVTVSALELNVPQALIYGWLLQLSYAFLPYLFRRVFLPGEPARLGGNWFSLITVGAGTVLQWASIFLGDYMRPAQATAYALWVLSMLPIVVELWNIVRSGLERSQPAVEADQLVAK